MLTEREQYRADKAKRIAEVIINAAEIAANSAPAAFPRKRPRMLKRMPARAHGYRRAQKRKAALSLAQLALASAIAKNQIAAIISQPIPKLNPGGIILENGPEYIQLNPNEKTLTSLPANSSLIPKRY